jgi:hypothetical protein
VVADKKGREPKALFWVERSPHDIWSKNSRRYEQEQVQFQNQKKPNSLNILGVMKSNRFRYAEHMIRRAEYLPKRARFKTMPEGRRKQRRRNLSGRMAFTTIPGTMGLVIGQTSFKIEYNGGIFSDKP